jgi:hypothetical protein
MLNYYQLVWHKCNVYANPWMVLPDKKRYGIGAWKLYLAYIRQAYVVVKRAMLIEDHYFILIIVVLVYFIINSCFIFFPGPFNILIF